MWRRRMIVIGALAAVLALGGYVGAGVIIYNRVSMVSPDCGGNFEGNTPASFSARNVDAQPFAMPDYETVSFPSRDANLTISGWYVPAENDAKAPTIILVHGWGDCKRAPSVLLPAGMLHKAGFNALLIDLRDHGESQIEDGRIAGGTEEYRDVLGAWDWLIAEKGAAPERIGLLGMSLGAATVLIATGEEPRVAAVWEDSSYGDINVQIQAELARNGYPTWLAPAAPFAGRLVSGDDLASLSPLRAVGKLDGRPAFIVHGDGDTRLSVQYAYDLADAIRAQGGSFDLWIAPGSGHIRAVFDYPQEYEEKLVGFFSENLQ